MTTMTDILKAAKGSHGSPFSKARTHKYIRRTPDGKGGWRYFYAPHNLRDRYAAPPKSLISPFPGAVPEYPPDSTPSDDELRNLRTSADPDDAAWAVEEDARRGHDLGWALVRANDPNDDAAEEIARTLFETGALTFGLPEEAARVRIGWGVGDDP